MVCNLSDAMVVIKEQARTIEVLREQIAQNIKELGTTPNKQSTQLCDNCATNKVAVSVCEPCLLKMIHRGA